MAIEKKSNIKKFYQQSPKPSNYVPNVLVTSGPAYPPLMSGLMQINPETKDIWISAGKELVSDWINITSGGGTPCPTCVTIFKDTKVGTEVKNTLVAGVTYSQFIPKDTITPGSIIRISYRVKKNTLANTGPAYLAINIGTSYPASSTIAFAEIDWSILLPNAYGQLKREFVVDSITSNTKYINNKASIFDDATQALTEEFAAINWTIDQTIYFTIQHLTSVTDSAAGSFYCIEIY
jgi:hypothetical protein